MVEEVNNALCNKSNGRCDIKAEKREELESKSSHKSDIWPPAASKHRKNCECCPGHSLTVSQPSKSLSL